MLLYIFLFNFKYIGDGDAKIVPRLTEDPPYPDLQIQKLEDLNHFAKKMYNRLEKRKKELNGRVIEGRKGIGGAGRITEGEFHFYTYIQVFFIQRSWSN